MNGDYSSSSLFLGEGRKFSLKIIVVASDPSLLGSICRLVKPPALEQLLQDEKARPLEELLNGR